MAVSATLRDLRNHFPRIRKLVEEEGEVILMDHGVPKYRLTRYTVAVARKAPAPKDYVARLRNYQRHPLGAAAARALHDACRGER